MKITLHFFVYVYYFLLELASESLIINTKNKLKNHHNKHLKCKQTYTSEEIIIGNLFTFSSVCSIIMLYRLPFSWNYFLINTPIVGHFYEHSIIFSSGNFHDVLFFENLFIRKSNVSCFLILYYIYILSYMTRDFLHCYVPLMSRTCLIIVDVQINGYSLIRQKFINNILTSLIEVSNAIPFIICLLATSRKITKL